jgi:hypothetical protein
MHRADLIIGLILVAFGVLVVSEAANMPRYANIGANPVTAPGLVPGILGGILAFLGLVMALRAALALRAGRSSGAPLEPTEVFGVDATIDAVPPSYVPEPPHASRRRLAIMFTMSLLFAAVAVGRLPFWLATFLFVFITVTLLELPRFSGKRDAAVRLTFALVIAGAVAYAIPYVFERIFLVRLP